MAKKKQKETKPDIMTLDGKEYDRNEFTDEQNAILNHINDMQMKLNTNAFMREQLTIGQEAFIDKLRTSHEELQLVQKRFDSNTGEALDDGVRSYSLSQVANERSQIANQISSLQDEDAGWEQLEKDLKAL